MTPNNKPTPTTSEKAKRPKASMKWFSNWQIKTDLIRVADVKAAIEAGLRTYGATIIEVKETYHAEPVEP